ncbi:MAG: sugar ABC transporter permease, partial [Treponema sp.]|nr:sugar ABC transporter permease [Treponema sp.]
MVPVIKPKHKKLDRMSGLALYALLLPSLIYLIIFYYVPMYGVQIAFKNFMPNLGIWGSPWVGFRYFTRLLQYPQLWPMIRNTLSITLYGLCTFPLAIILALMLNELKSIKFKKTIQMVSYAPYFLSTVVM